MSTSAAFVITLPQAAADYVQQLVEEGAFESPSDYIETLIVHDMLDEAPSEADLVQWMNTEGACRVENLRADPSRGLTAEQAFAGLLGDNEGEERDG